MSDSANNTAPSTGALRFLKPQHAAAIEASLIGLAAGSSAWMLATGVDFIGSFRLKLTESFSPWIVLPLFGIVGGLIAGFLVQKFAPDATGSGIPQVKAFLLNVRVAMNIPLALVKFIGGTICLGSGLFMGREGPSVHVGASLAHEMHRWFPSTSDRQRQLIAAGAGAGLAAAFNAPVAGVLFILEELLKDLSAKTIGSAILACFVGSMIAQVLGATPGIHHVKEAAAQSNFFVTDIPGLVILGVACGALGAVFNKSVIFMLNVNKAIRAPLCIRVALAGLFSGLLVASLPKEFWNYAGMRELIIMGHTHWTWAMVSFGVFFALTAVAYGSGAPGGLFAPALAMGSSLGYLIGMIQHSLIGSGSLETFALAGMGAFFCGVARVPITSIVIIFEMTENFGVVLPLMIVSLTAYVIAEKISEGSVYDLLMDFAGLSPPEKKAERDLPEGKAPDIFDLPSFELSISQLCDSTAPRVSSDSQLSEVLKSLKEASHESVVVVDGDQIAGMLTVKNLPLEDIQPDAAEQLLSKQLQHPQWLVHPGTSAIEALNLFLESAGTPLPVISEDGKLVGVITAHSVSSVLAQRVCDTASVKSMNR